MTTRREFVEEVAAAGLVLPAGAAVARVGRLVNEVPVQPTPRDLHRAPDRVVVQTAGAEQVLRPGTSARDRWTGGDGIVVTTETQADGGGVHVTLASSSVPIKRIYLRWQSDLRDVKLFLGDAWERAYGDLEWRASAPDRVMPWYFATFDGKHTVCYGVLTGARAFCYWQADDGGVSVCADVRSGSAGVELGTRTLDVCDVVMSDMSASPNAFAAVHAFCGKLCRAPRLPTEPVYGSNDWYWAYGNNSADTVRADAQRLLELSPSTGVRPFVVIDDGWQPGRGQVNAGEGAWDRGNEKFPDMPGLAAELRRAGARPGIWIRPLRASADSPDAWRLTRDRTVLDPTVPEVREKVATDIARLRDWGFELVKHDYTTFDIFGRWGYQMGTALTRDGWTFAGGRSRTNAEVISDLYATIRTAAGASLVLGCNTVSHLSAGYFEICRIGDDTSGTDWSRTRKMGVNSLGFRGAQHGAFYVADADCVAVTTAVPWSFTRQWLELASRSGTALFVSLAPDAVGEEQQRDLKQALALAARAQPLAEPLDWQHTIYPRRWRLSGTVGGREAGFDWVGADGVGLPV